MSQHLSDAGRFLRALTHLSRRVIEEARKSTDYPQRTPKSLEVLGSVVSAGLNRFNQNSVSKTGSTAIWKSSVLIRQTGIAVTNAIRATPRHSWTFDPSKETTPDAVPLVQSTSTTVSSATVKANASIPNILETSQPSISIDSELKSSLLGTTEITNNIVQKNTIIASKQVPIDSTTILSETVSKPVTLNRMESIQSEVMSPSTMSIKSSSTSSSSQSISSSPIPANSEGQARAVPTTRIGRLASFGSLAAGLGVGALGSIVRRSVGLEETPSSQALLSPYLSKANAERIVDTLCKVRGAALKLGQMVSIQDNFLVQEDIQKIFERVRQKADFMPEWQMNDAMSAEFGSNWRDQFEEFQDRPFAAASIGQVHYGIVKGSKQRVAVKIQYPGVGKSIESDINNLITLLNFWNIIPRGLYIESVINVAKRELNWEVDYVREAEWNRRFQRWLVNYPMFRIPAVIDHLSTKNVLTTAFFDGITLDNAINEDQETRNRIGESILELCLLELFKFKAMQTDPNWSNFLFDPSTKTIGLIDFGSSRDFRPGFVDNYIQIIRASADNDAKRVEKLSVEGGFLTGYETREMVDAHVKAVMILGEVFRRPEPFDFGQQNTTHSIHKLIPIMLKHRLTPPPEDTYSLHRKMAGAFLLCSKLGSRIRCQPLFDKIWKDYKFS